MGEGCWWLAMSDEMGGGEEFARKGGYVNALYGSEERQQCVGNDKPRLRSLTRQYM